MWLTLLGLLGALVGAAAALLAAPYERWIQGWVQPHFQRSWRRMFFALAFVVVLVPAAALGVNPFRDADNTPGVVYVLGLIVGISGAVAVRRRKRRR
jgi:uncharacterized membrane protein YhaH (DUF805 family)